MIVFEGGLCITVKMIPNTWGVCIYVTEPVLPKLYVEIKRKNINSITHVSNDQILDQLR